MYFDDIMNQYHHLEIGGKRLCDAVPFRLPNNYLDIYDLKNYQDKNLFHLTSKAIMPPYNNLVIYEKKHNIFLWCIKIPILDRDNNTFVIMLFDFTKAVFGMNFSMAEKNNTLRLPREIIFNYSVFREAKIKGLAPHLSSVLVSPEEDCCISFVLGYDGTVLNMGPIREIEKHLITMGITNIYTMFYLFNLLNCGNIGTRKNVPNNKTQKKRIRHGKLPLYSYYTLVVGGGGQRKSFKHDSIGQHNRIHLCRGHFKHYTEDNKLFGKYTGLWWWQPSVRGQNKKGIVVKDYELKTRNHRPTVK